MEVPLQNLITGVENSKKEIEQVMQIGALAYCAEMLGGAQRVMEMTLDYARQRNQFGHPIGSLQAIQHYCANMAIDIDASKLHVYKAAWTIDEGNDSGALVSVAKAWCNDAYRRVLNLAHQIHGAIGWTKEMDLELYTRRSVGMISTFGDADFHREQIARYLNF
ncbi:MAG: hypothetical protein A2Z02_04350 [Chloroflexi bacterium RBG_16_48_7]|nr:MAG: hypothetical protein A2Z02_04350 [Chloroflexi bacterium RBG_16_48_7]